jgi:uncharacterized membrane protein
MDAFPGLPPVRSIGFGAPFDWLKRGWRDFSAIPAASLAYGLAVAILSATIVWALLRSNASFWALALSCGFVFLAPMLAMGLYEASRRLEAGERPKLEQMTFVRSAFRGDVATLGTILLVIYFLWGRIAQIVYGLSSRRLHRTVDEFVDFVVNSQEGRDMLMIGSAIGGVMAFFVFALVIVSAPMMLDRNNTVFASMITSLRAVSRNLGPLLLWAAIIVALLLCAAATGFLALTVLFPWLGYASWHAYRDLIDASAMAASNPA